MAVVEIGDRRSWAHEKVEAWIIRDVKTKNVLSPAGKYIFDNEANALKSFYRFIGSKAEAQAYLDEIEIVCIGTSD